MSHKYPSRESIELPDPGRASPDQEYYHGWYVQHNRLWLAVIFLGLLSAFLGASLLLTTVRYSPSVQYVTLDGGYPVVWNDYGNIVIDEREYVPARLRAVVMNFVENRYGYDYQNLQKINSALRLMSTEAAAEERDKIRALDLANTIGATNTKVTLRPNYSDWQVVPLGNGRFEITLPGEAAITDAEHQDGRAPLVRNFTLSLTIQTVPATETNPLGYVIVSTGRDIL